jgi:hypothetical protein
LSGLGRRAQARARPIAWVDQFGSRSSESGTWGLDVFANGVFTGGRTFGSLPGQVSRGGADAWIRRTNARGSAVWTVQFGTPAFDNVEDVDATSSGVYVLGATRGALGGPSAGGTDAYLAKFDPEGKQLVTSYDPENCQIYIDEGRLSNLGLTLHDLAQFLESQPYMFAVFTNDEVRRAAEAAKR